MKRNPSLARFLIVLLLLSLAFPAEAALNPSAVYCQALGYEFSIQETSKGQRGLCTLPDETVVDAWDFLAGRTALEHSYCVQQGYGYKRVMESDLCRDCLVCILPDGSEGEVTRLMGLDFDETTCGDGTCGIKENYDSCPADCPSGHVDMLCDGVADGTCDPDCTTVNGTGFAAEKDPDCTKQPADEQSTESNLSIIILLLGVIIVLLILILIRK